MPWEKNKALADDCCWKLLLACLLLASTLIIALVVPGFLGGFLTVNDCKTTVRSIHIIWACHLWGLFGTRHFFYRGLGYCEIAQVDCPRQAQKDLPFFFPLGFDNNCCSSLGLVFLSLLLYYFSGLDFVLSVLSIIPPPSTRTNHLVIGHLIHHLPPS